MMWTWLLLIFLSPFALATSDFRMLDHTGTSLSLYELRQKKAVVIVWQGNHCPIFQKSIPELNRVRSLYEKKNVAFLLMNANPQDRLDDIASEVDRLKPGLSVLKDDYQSWSREVGTLRTATAVILLPEKNFSIVYRGPVDGSIGYDSVNARSRPLLEENLKRVLAGGSKLIERPVRGCLITYEEKVPDYASEVAPILRSRCQNCHANGETATFSLDNHATARGWSRMMRETIMTRRMPPWNIDTRYEKFSPDLGIPEEEAKTVLRWIEAGAPATEKNDPLTEPLVMKKDLFGRTADHIHRFSAVNVPAKAPFAYQYRFLKNPFGKDVWLHGVRMSPSNKRVLHHARAFQMVDPKTFSMKDSKFLSGYVPGVMVSPFPAGSGKLLKKDEGILVELHYVPDGIPERDETTIELFLLESPPEKEFFLVINPRLSEIDLPPGKKNIRYETKKFFFDRPTRLHSVSLHMHYRGKSGKIFLHHLDGKKETLLSVPDFSIDWQHRYLFAVPRDLPPGTAISAEAVYDNSDTNPRNPDPKKHVKFGFSIEDEMMDVNLGYSQDRVAEGAQ